MSIPIIDMKPNGPDEIDQRVEEDALRCIKEAEHYALRPVLGMIYKPKITVRKILDLDYPIKYAVLLIFIAGFVQSLNTYISLPESASIEHFAIVTTAGGIGTLITSLILLAIIRGVGSLFSGRASYRDLIQAWGWSSVPSIVLMLVWGLRYAIVGPEFFSLEADVQVREPVLDRVLLYLVFVQVGVMVWQAILTFICIQVVQQLNFFKAFVLAIICAIISIIFYAFMATIFG